MKHILCALLIILAAAGAARAQDAAEPTCPPGMELVSPGVYHIGCSPGDADCRGDETPQRARCSAGPILHGQVRSHPVRL